MGTVPSKRDRDDYVDSLNSSDTPFHHADTAAIVSKRTGLDTSIAAASTTTTSEEDESTIVNTGFALLPDESKVNKIVMTPMKTTVSIPPPSSALHGKEGICLIEVVSVEWVWTYPWQRTTQRRSTGSGFVVQHSTTNGMGKNKNYILTSAHVVASAIDIRVRLHGVSRRFLAKVTVYAPDTDLALLELNDEKEEDEFFGADRNALAMEFVSDLPALQERVHVVGFPSGGRTICVTEGVVSRIDNLSLVAPAGTIPSIQIDAAINAGNSGGPVFNSRGLVTGVAFCKANSKGSDNIGYVIPASVVQAFLGRCHEDGSYSFLPSVPYLWHALENKSLRLYHDVPDDIHGVLLTDVSKTVQSALQKNDILTRIDSHAIADDGQVVLRGNELIQHRYLLRSKRIDENTTFTVYRKGKVMESKPCVLSFIPDICPRWPDVDHFPDYLIVGALVFLPMTHMLMKKKDAGTRLYATYYNWIRLWPNEWGDMEELVVLTNIFVHELSFSYRRIWRRVLAYNGKAVKSLHHLGTMWETSCAEAKKSPHTKSFARLKLEHDDDIVLEVQAAMEAQAEILETHQIRKSSQRSPRNAKYRLNAGEPRK